MSGDAAEIHARAVALLSRREHSRAELERKLGARGFSAVAIAPVLDDLAAASLLSDRRFAEEYVRSRRGRGFGPLRILEELAQRGVDGAIRDEACPRRDRAWSEIARSARGKRFGGEPPAAVAERARQARFLSRRGFTRAQIAAALGADPEEEA